MNQQEKNKHSRSLRQFWNERHLGEVQREERDPKKAVHTDLLWREILRCIDGRKSLTILDAGCGPGRFTIPLAQMGHKLTAFDISSSMIEQAQLRASKEKWSTAIHSEVRDLSDPLPYATDAFDIVLCLDSPLSFCPTTYKANLHELVRVAKDQLVFCVMNRFGVVLEDAGEFDIPHFGRLNTLWDVFRTGTLNVTPEIHALEPNLMPSWHAFTPSEFSALLEAEGCTIQRISAPGTFVRSMPLELFQTLVVNDAAYADLLNFEEEFDSHPDIRGVGAIRAGGLLVSAKKM